MGDGVGVAVTGGFSLGAGGTNPGYFNSLSYQIAEDVDLIIRTAAGAIGDPSRVINGLRVGGVMQVQLDVVIARVARSEARSMGFSFFHASSDIT